MFGWRAFCSHKSATKLIDEKSLQNFFIQYDSFRMIANVIVNKGQYMLQ